MKKPSLPLAANSIQKGIPLKYVLDKPAVNQLAKNIKMVYKAFDDQEFVLEVLSDLQALTLKERADCIAKALKKYLPNSYSAAIEILLASLTPPLTQTENNSLSGMFYMPHNSFIEHYGLDIEYNGGVDPYEISMNALYELTKRFTSENSIRTFIIDQPQRTFDILYQWMSDVDPHVRRLCSEGTRPRLPWASRIPDLVKDPSPSFPILEHLKNDPELYVRRSVANHIGDIAKDHLGLALNFCENWLPDATGELKWVIRHALRYPAKKGVERALQIRTRAK